MDIGDYFASIYTSVVQTVLNAANIQWIENVLRKKIKKKLKNSPERHKIEKSEETESMKDIHPKGISQIKTRKKGK